MHHSTPAMPPEKIPCLAMTLLRDFANLKGHFPTSPISYTAAIGPSQRGISVESDIGAKRLTSFIYKEIKELNSLKNKNCLLLEEEN